MSKISKERKKLSLVNREVFDNMNMYLYAKNINDLIRVDILMDILGMLQESEKRGIKAEEAIGDYEVFCDEIANNAIKKTKWESILFILIKLGIVFVIIFTYFMYDFISGEYLITNGNLFITKSYLTMAMGISFASLVAIDIRNRFLYRFPHGYMYIYAFIYFLIYFSISFVIRNMVEEMIAIPIVFLIIMLIIYIILLFLYLSIRKANFQKYMMNKN